MFTKVEHWVKIGMMKKDAFDDLDSGERFGYKKQLREARAALDAKVYNYVLRFPNIGYRTIAKRLRISPAKLCNILRQFDHSRMPGRRKQRKMTRPISVPPPPVAVAVFVSHDLSSEDVELALETLDRCVMERRADGEDSYLNVVHWLKKRRGSKVLRDRAKYLVQRYEKLGR